MHKSGISGKILKFILKMIVLVVAGLLTFFIWQTFSEFDPDPLQDLAITEDAAVVDDTLTLTTFNIGYCGLGAGMDFFYEGGTMVRPGKELYDRYLGEVMQRLETFIGSDFILLQEVDTLAKRSWYANQFRLIRNKFNGFHSFFAMNYNAWVPMPVLKPMGKVQAGIVTLSKATPVSASRYAFSSGYSWPMRMFMLKRCYLLTRYNTDNGKQLVLVNTHNSAFGDAAEIRAEELAQLKEMMTGEYAKGNYVIIGGDWNQNPAIFDSTVVLENYLVKSIRPPVPADFLPEGWQYAYDPLHPTNRDVDIPYLEGRTKTTLIDFFVLSPNVGLVSAITTPTGFKESDHQPVSVKVFLKN